MKEKIVCECGNDKWIYKFTSYIAVTGVETHKEYQCSECGGLYFKKKKIKNATIKKIKLYKD